MMIQKLYISKYLEAIISFIVLLPVSISFILNPLTNDARVYNGLAKITDYFGQFPMNVDLVWEVKPIGNRMLYYILYKITSFFTTFQTYEYEILFKVISALIVLIICYYFSTKINKKYIFLLTAMAFLTPLNFITMQPDWWACLFAFLSLSLFMTDKKSNWYLSGALVTIIFLFKGSTLFLVFPVACALYLLKPNWFDRLKFGACGSILFLCFIVFSNLFKNMIPDMLLSAKIAHVGAMDLVTMTSHFIINALTIWIYIPAFIVGVFAAYFLYVKYIKEKEFKSIVVLILMWMTASISTFIQSEYFLYQYVPILFAGVITIILLSDHAIKYSIFIMFLIFVVFSGYWGMGMIVEKNFYGDQFKMVDNIKNNFPDITTQENILYLDSGVAPYYFPSNTSCRFVQPLPFQRNTQVWKTSDTEQYKELYNCIMVYNGKYIIEDNSEWFHQNTTDSKVMWNKINSEYEKVWEDNWKIYRRI